jgi:hydroxyacylglutathione hydrolase
MFRWFMLATLPLLACATRVSGPHGIEGGREADGFFYVVPVTGGVVLVDTGEDERGVLLDQLISDRPVLGVVITHAHHDHCAAAFRFPTVEVFVGADDIARMKGETQHQGVIQTQWRASNGGLDRLPPLPAQLSALVDRQQLEFGDETFRAIAVPGHTPGSFVFLFRDVLFGGDTAMAIDGAIRPIDDGYSDDPPLARSSLATLREERFTTVMDGHRGITSLGPSALPPPE